MSDRLTDNPILDAGDIDVAVEHGEVTLNGSVDSRYSKRLAEDIADEVSGVRHVQNNLRVRQSDRGWETSELGRTDRSGLSGSTGTGNTSGAMTGTAGAVAGTTSATPAATPTRSGLAAPRRGARARDKYLLQTVSFTSPANAERPVGEANRVSYNGRMRLRPSPIPP